MPLLPADTPRQDSKPKAINEFIAQVRGSGMMRQNRFAVLLTPPVSILPENLKHVLLFCDSVQLPGTNFSTVQNRTYGEFREVPYEKLYDPCNLTFYVDGDLKVKQLFDRWTNQIQDPVTRNFNYYDNYVCDMTIQVQDLQDNSRYDMILHECYPKTVGSIQLDHANKDVMKLNVTMQFKWHETHAQQVLYTYEQVSSEDIERANKDFTGYQQTINKSFLQKAGDFLTGSAITYGITKLPGLLRF